MRVALAQMLVEGGRVRSNVGRALDRVRSAAEDGADLVVLPEALNFGWSHPSAREKAEPFPSCPAFRKIAASARRHRVFICAGLVERSGDRLYNSAVLFDRGGRALCVHRKINELDFAREIYDVGSDAGAVVETEFGRIGLQVCADGFAEGQWIGRRLGRLGADLILSPCAWAVDADFDPDDQPYGDLWRENFRPVAEEFGLWIFACSNVGIIEEGAWRGRHCIGNSMAFAPGGREILTGPFGVEADELLWVEA